MELPTLKTYVEIALAISLGLAGGNYLANKYIPNQPVITQPDSRNWYEQSIVPVLPRKRH